MSPVFPGYPPQGHRGSLVLRDPRGQAAHAWRQTKEVKFGPFQACVATGPEEMCSEAMGLSIASMGSRRETDIFALPLRFAEGLQRHPKTRSGGPALRLKHDGQSKSRETDKHRRKQARMTAVVIDISEIMVNLNWFN